MKTIVKIYALIICFSYFIMNSIFSSQHLILLRQQFNAIQQSQDFINILKFLFHLKAFTIDLKTLKNLSDSGELFFPKSNKISFGIYGEDLNENKLNNYAKFYLICEKTITKCENSKNASKIVLNCADTQITINVLYNHGKNLWSCKDSVNDLDNQLLGDTERLLNKFSLARVKTELFSLLVPHKIDQFLFDYNISRLIKCNYRLYDANRSKFDYSKNAIRLKHMLPSLEHVVSKLTRLRKHYWLAGGTLLGWYRDCGIIPFSTDIDLALWSHEYEPRIKEAFRGDSKTPLMLKLGFESDSYELRLHDRCLQIDLFFTYKHNETHQWLGYQEKLKKYKRWLDNFSELCSSELSGLKVTVPCDPVRYLNKEYGENKWLEPKSGNIYWSNLDYNYSLWSRDELAKLIQFYRRDGREDAFETGFYIKSYDVLVT